MTKSLRLIFLLLITYFKRNWQTILFLVLFIIFLIFIQLKFSVITFNSNTISEGLVGTYQNHDLPQEVTRLLSKSLVEPDKSGRMQPLLSSGWEVNKDATQYKFKLKKGLKWTDGSQIKSTDIEFAIPNTVASYPDENTILFKLKESYSAFPSLLTKPIFKKGTLVGVGPYYVISINDSQIFIAKIVLGSKLAGLPKVVIRFYPNEKTAVTGFNLGDVQSLLGVSSYLVSGDKGLLSSPLVKMQSKVDYTKLVAVFYNTSDKQLSNRSFREALGFGAPSIKGEVEANNPYPPSSWAFNSDVKDYLNNSAEAKAALERAKNNSSTDLLKKEITLTTTSQLEDVGKKVIEAWRNLGINAVLRIESGIPQKFQSLLITQAIPADPDQYFLWHESQKETNLTNYSQKRVDKDLEDARKLIKESDRKEKYLDFQKVLLSDSPATFLYFPKYTIFYYGKSGKLLDKILPLQFSPMTRN